MSRIPAELSLKPWETRSLASRASVPGWQDTYTTRAGPSASHPLHDCASARPRGVQQHPIVASARPRKVVDFIKQVAGVIADVADAVEPRILSGPLRQGRLALDAGDAGHVARHGKAEIAEPTEQVQHIMPRRQSQRLDGKRSPSSH